MKRHPSKGLTLIELLIGVCLSSIVVLALYGILTSQNRTYALQDDASTMQQNLRVALESMARNIRMGGFGKLSTWTTMAGYADTDGRRFRQSELRRLSNVGDRQ